MKVRDTDHYTSEYVGTFAEKWDELIDIIRGSTGLDFSKDELQLFANRITEQTRYYNTREGIGPEGDILPPALTDKPNLEGAVISSEELTVLLEEYNQIRKERYEKAEAHTRL